MQEILLDFKEFKERWKQGTQEPRAHYSFSREEKPPFVAATFRLQFVEHGAEITNIVIFEKHTLKTQFEDEELQLWSEECKKQAAEINATPGYYQEGSQ